MSKLAFLKTIKVIGETKAPVVRSKVSRNPEGMRLRVYRNGAIYPSMDLIKAFDLEYKNRPTEEQIKASKLEEGAVALEHPGYGFDIFPSEDFKAIQSAASLIFIAPVAKNEPKVDVFGSTVYNEDNTPKASVADQGTVTFGKETLIPMLKEVYGIEFPEEVKFRDFDVLDSTGEPGQIAAPFMMPEGKPIAFVPKKVSRGKKEGEMTVVRRNDPKVYFIYPVDVVEEEQVESEAEPETSDADVFQDDQSAQ